MANQDIAVGIMKMDVAGEDARSLSALTEGATERFAREVRRETRLSVQPLTFDGPNLQPVEGAYPALDFVQIGINEKTERKLSFLIIITEVEISAASLNYLLALPSQLTNVSIISTRRLAEVGSREHENLALMTDRLGTLMLHCFGRMLNLSHHESPTNYMARIREPHDLDPMREFTEQQFKKMGEVLPEEANDRFSKGNRTGFVISQTISNVTRIFRAAFRANPIKIASKLPTMIATALSVIVILVFGAETWDFAASVSTSQLATFIVVTFIAATYVLYQAFSFKLVADRHGEISESAVVTAGATYLAVFLTLVVLFVLFALLMYGLIVFVFPDALMSTWTTAEDGSSFGDHLRLSLFLASVGVLSGSLGGSADTRNVVRNVLFAVDET